MKKLVTIAMAASVVALAASCGGPKKISSDPRLSHIQEGATLELQFNLHPTEAKRTVSALNYQPAALLPRCTKVTINAIDKRRVFFTTESGVQYRWEADKHIRQDFGHHFAEFFVEHCDNPTLEGFSNEDKQGITDGEVFEGMSKKGVLFAIGLPPDHETPNLDQSVWTYWKNPFARKQVKFDGDIVKEVK